LSVRGLEIRTEESTGELGFFQLGTDCLQICFFNIGALKLGISDTVQFDVDPFPAVFIKLCNALKLFCFNLLPENFKWIRDQTR
jgi:hypothetical protein